MDPNSIKRESTTRSGLFLLSLVVVIVAVVGIVAWVFVTYPDVLENLVYAILIIIGAIIVIAVAICLLMMILAIPFYIKKGETYQDDISYDMSDVKSVKETDSEDRKE